MGAACSDNRTTIEKQIDDFLLMLKKMPDLTKYKHSKTNVATFTKSWASPIFGGCVLNAVGTRTKPKSRKNSLE